jgi:HSP20 family molecular chaperone IbpA
MWDPFWFMRAMLSWGRPTDAPSFDVKETDDTYVCRVNAKLMLPQQADAAHVKAELKDGELTLVVPKAAAPEPEQEQEQDSVSASPKARRPRGNGRRGSAKRRPRRRART